MKATWKVSLLFERRIESDGRLVNMPFVKLQPVKGDGDMFFSVPGGAVEFVPEKIDVREASNGTIVQHKVISANTLISKVTSPDGEEWLQGAEVSLSLAPSRG